MSRGKTVVGLKAASAIVAGFGIVGLLGTDPATAWPVHLLVDLAFWPLDPAESGSAAEARLLWGINAGILAGWGVMLWQVAASLFPKDPALARRIILTGIGTWFVVDGAGSVLAGAPMNAVYNLFFLAIFAVPLLRRFSEKPAAV